MPALSEAERVSPVLRDMGTGSLRDFGWLAGVERF